jgi:hypothetical protein
VHVCGGPPPPPSKEQVLGRGKNRNSCFSEASPPFRSSQFFQFVSVLILSRVVATRLDGLCELCRSLQGGLVLPATPPHTKVQCLSYCRYRNLYVLILFCWPCIIVHRYNETNVMHFLFSLLRINGLYRFRALLAHPQKAIHKQRLVYCVRVKFTPGLKCHFNPGLRWNFNNPGACNTSLNTTRPSTIFYRLLLNWASLRRY